MPSCLRSTLNCVVHAQCQRDVRGCHAINMVCAWFYAAAHRRNLPTSSVSGVAQPAHNTGSGCWCDKKSTLAHTQALLEYREGVQVQTPQTERRAQAHRAAAHCQHSRHHHHHRCRVQLNSTSAQCHTTLHTTSRTYTMYTRRSDAHSRPSPRLRSSYP